MTAQIHLLSLNQYSFGETVSQVLSSWTPLTELVDYCYIFGVQIIYHILDSQFTGLSIWLCSQESGDQKEAECDIAEVEYQKNECHALTEQQYDDIIDSVLEKAASGLLFKAGKLGCPTFWRLLRKNKLESNSDRIFVAD